MWQCLSTSIDNLRNRAERLAAQLAHGEGVATATAIETRSRILPNFAGEGWPSYGVSLTATAGNIGSAETIACKLAKSRFAAASKGIESCSISVLSYRDKIA